MKKYLLLFLAAITLLLILTSCSRNEPSLEFDTNEPSMFSVAEIGQSWYVMYHRETKVMYAVSNGDYNRGRSWYS